MLPERPPVVLWLSGPDYTGHHTPLSLPEHKRAIAAANGNVRRVTETVALLDPAAENTIRRRLRLRRVLFIASHGIAAA